MDQMWQTSRVRGLKRKDLQTEHGKNHQQVSLPPAKHAAQPEALMGLADNKAPFPPAPFHAPPRQSTQPLPSTSSSSPKTPRYRNFAFSTTQDFDPFNHGQDYDSQDDTVLLSDSICKYQQRIWNLYLITYPGINVDELIAKVDSNDIPFKAIPKIVIIHAGTNNLDINPSDDEIVDKILLLASKVHSKTKAVIAISLLIPCLDNVKLNTRVKLINQLILKKVDPRFMNCIFTFRAFIDKGRINRSLYTTVDKIHPNAQGNRRLFEFLQTRVNEIRIGLNLPRQERPPPRKIEIRKGKKGW